jgi:hypothetical protein
MIPMPRKDSQGKIEGEFYPLQKAELIALHKAKLINNAAFVHLALRYENPYCDRPIEAIPKEFALRWSMPESSVYEAIAKLKEKGILNIKTGRVVVQWSESDCQQAETIDFRQEDNSGNPELLRDPRKNSGSSENRTPETISSKASSTLQTIKTYSDFIQTLSESERESFLNFGLEKCKALPKLPELPMKWIEANWQELYALFLSTPGAVAASIADTDWTSHPDWSDWLAQMREGVPRFVGWGTCFDNKTRRAIADWADDRGLIWGAES